MDHLAELATVLCVIAAGLLACQQARTGGEWSWRGFGWTLLLVILYAGTTVAAGFALDDAVGASDPLARTLCIVAPIAIGAVPLAIVAKQIQKKHSRAR
jgi:hypothetical protein